MTDERDPKVSRRYRGLGSEEPSRELDQAILAAAHRAADRAHPPLVTPAGKHRWYFAVGAAAVLALAVAVTLHLERDRPDAELASAPAAPPAPADDKVQRRAAETQAKEARREAAAVAALPGSVQTTVRPDTPQRWLERIIELRKAGRHDEADKELAEFRKRYPDHKLPENVVRP